MKDVHHKIRLLPLSLGCSLILSAIVKSWIKNSLDKLIVFTLLPIAFSLFIRRQSVLRIYTKRRGSKGCTNLLKSIIYQNTSMDCCSARFSLLTIWLDLKLETKIWLLKLITLLCKNIIQLQYLTIAHHDLTIVSSVSTRHWFMIWLDILW